MELIAIHSHLLCPRLQGEVDIPQRQYNTCRDCRFSGQESQGGFGK